MNTDRQYELLSGYLDGELSAEEQAQAEQLLADDADARRLYEELRALSGALQALPRHRLGESLADKVLRRAERSVLSAPVAPPVDPAPRISFGRSPRSWAWAGLALAAALLIMVVNREPPQMAEVAQQAERAERTKRAERPAPESSISALRDEAAPADAPEFAPSPPKADAMRTREFAQDSDQVGDALVATKQEERKSATPAPSAPAATPAPPVIADAAPGEGGFGAASGESPLMLKASPAPVTAPATAPANLAAVEDEGLQNQLEQLSSEGVLVVQVEMRQTAYEAGEFDALLSRNAIAVIDHPVGGDAALGGERSREFAPSKGGEVAAQQQLAQPGQQAQSATAPAQLADGQRAAPLRARRMAPQAQAGDVEMVYVEAPPQAVEATLAELAAQTADVPAIDVEPAPGFERQQSYSNYGRGNVRQQYFFNARGAFAEPADKSKDVAANAPVNQPAADQAGARQQRFKGAARPEAQSLAGQAAGANQALESEATQREAPDLSGYAVQGKRADSNLARQLTQGRAQRVYGPSLDALSSRQSALNQNQNAAPPPARAEKSQRDDRVSGGKLPEPATLQLAPNAAAQSEAAHEFQQEPLVVPAEEAMRVLFVFRLLPDEPAPPAEADAEPAPVAAPAVDPSQNVEQ